MSWYTESITADTSDYVAIISESQNSNGYQSRKGGMGRTFHTRHDPFPELRETFRVGFLNAAVGGDGGECVVTIIDNDPVGIHKLEITSEPSNGEAYTAGEVIEITARFTGRVSNRNGHTGRKADYAGITLTIGIERRGAEMLRDDGTDTIVFGYEVQKGDSDPNGIGLEQGFPNARPRTGWVYRGERDLQVGLWTVESGRTQKASLFYQGLDENRHHKVDA